MKLKLRKKILLLYGVVCFCIIVFVGASLSIKLKQDKFTTIYRNFQDQLTHIDFALTGFLVVTKRGKIAWLYSKGGIVEWDEHGSPLRMVGTVMDITERKRMEDELIIAKNKAEDPPRLRAIFLPT